MDTEKNFLLTALGYEDNQPFLKSLLETPIYRGSAKSAEDSENYRFEGNVLYLQLSHDAEKHIEIFRYYCLSISSAPLGSEILAKAYGNRSALLCHIQKYEDCLKDIDRALNITGLKSDSLTVKLLCRKVECMKKLALPDWQSVLETVEDLADNIIENDKDLVARFIDKAKTCSIGDEKCSKNAVNENDVLPQVDQPLDCVSIKYDENYGRYLVAKKDYKPGDFIIRDDLYVTLLNQEMRHTNCENCLKICWSGLACDHCDWAMFCSEECKTEACNRFHDIECTLLLLSPCHLTYFKEIRVAVRILSVGIREMGSIEKLREELALIDRSTDNCYKGFYKDGQLASNSIRSIYSLECCKHSKIDAQALALDAVNVLIAIVKNSQLIKNVKFDKIDDLTENEDFMFLASLLMKFALISINNIFLMNCDCKRLKRTDYKCCDRGSGLSTLCSLLNHSCNPNAARIFTEERKVNIFALRPIEKNTQIFITYTASFYNKSLADRNKLLKQYNFTCKCEACTGSWPHFFKFPYEELVAKQSTAEKNLYKYCRYIFDALDVNKIDFSRKDIKILCQTIMQANKRLTEPTYLMAALEDSLLLIYSRIYGWKSPIHAFGNCSKEQ